MVIGGAPVAVQHPCDPGTSPHQLYPSARTLQKVRATEQRLVEVEAELETRTIAMETEMLSRVGHLEASLGAAREAEAAAVSKAAAALAQQSTLRTRLAAEREGAEQAVQAEEVARRAVSDPLCRPHPAARPPCHPPARPFGVTGRGGLPPLR